MASKNCKRWVAKSFIQNQAKCSQECYLTKFHKNFGDCIRKSQDEDIKSMSKPLLLVPFIVSAVSIFCYSFFTVGVAVAEKHTRQRKCLQPANMPANASSD